MDKVPLSLLTTCLCKNYEYYICLLGLKEHHIKLAICPCDFNHRLLEFSFTDTILVLCINGDGLCLFPTGQFRLLSQSHHG